MRKPGTLTTGTAISVPFEAAEVGVVEQAAQDADAVELVAVDRGGDEQGGPGRAADHRHRHGHRLGGVGLGHLEPQLGRLAQGDGGAGEAEGLARWIIVIRAPGCAGGLVGARSRTKSIIAPATSTPVAPSIPSRPGELLTSSTIGPLLGGDHVHPGDVEAQHLGGVDGRRT